MTDLVAFLRARLDEDEAVAKAATPGPWRVEPYAYGPDGPFEMEVRAAGATVVSHQPHEGGGFTHAPDADHIARHDPARVLADVEAKRRIVELHTPRIVAGGSAVVCFSCRANDNSGRWRDAPCPTLRLLAQPYADHPDYDESWRP